MDRSAEARSRLEQSAALHQESMSLAPQIVPAVRLIVDAFQAGRKVLLFGNGGSAADAQHLAGELMGRFRMDRPPLAAIALTTDTSVLTAVANDFSFQSVFARSVEGLAQEGDIVIALSTSGESQNVIEGVAAARRKGAKTIALCGAKGRLASMCDVSLAVPSTDTPRIQEVHITLGHIICELVEEELFGRESGRRSGLSDRES